jgi:hypothetical protein
VKRRVLLHASLAMLTATVAVIPPAYADPEIDGGVEGDTVFVAAVEATETGASATEVAGGTSEGPVFVAYRWRSVCQGAYFTDEPAVQMDCGAARVCADDSERLYRLWGRLESGQWLAMGAQCLGAPPSEDETPSPRITPALVLEELRRIGLPTLQARTQPEGKTLVNFDTIFYTDAEPFSATVTLLGRQVEVIAEPASYTWHHGDGTERTTTSPGAPYPSREIIYRYSDADTTVNPRVDVTYHARFRVSNGAWQDIDETVTIPGPEGNLRVAQARAALSGDYS